MKYQPINCNFYDYFEAAITLRKKVAITYFDIDGKQVNAEVFPVDLVNQNKEEFLLLKSGVSIRLDRIIMFDHVPNPGGACSF
ncbi:MAG: Rho-binding antiterminator [Bacteroidota bacterium]